MSQWRRAAFAEVVEAKGSGAAGLPQSEWAVEGRYPVIGQGANYVEGWTNRDDLVLRPDPAVVLYGGHTRRAKFVECPFVPGPNVKILKPSRDLDAKFLFYFLVQLPIASRGYADHFPEVRRCRVPIPPLPEQRRVAEILDSADALRATRRTALDQLETLSQSILVDMFGSPATNPMGWPGITLGDALVTIRNGVNAEQSEEPGGWPITRIETIADGTINPVRVRWIEPDPSLVEDYRLEPGDILFSHINSVEHIAKTALYAGTPFPLIHGINLLRLRPKLEAIDPVWLLHLLKHEAVRTHFRTRCKRAVNQASLNQPDIKSLRIFLPPLGLQHAFAHRIAAVGNLKAALCDSLAELDHLFASLQDRAFLGEL